MKTRILALVALLFISISYSLYAIPANNNPITRKQADGRNITFVMNGDEFIKWAKSIDNYTLIANKEGVLVYAQKDENGDLVPSSYIAVNPDERKTDEILFLSSIEPNLFYSERQISLKTQARIQKTTTIDKTPTTGTPNFLVILVNYSDLAFTYTSSDFQNMINQTNYTTNNSTGSVKDYFFDNSRGLLNPNFTVIGPVTLPHNAAYYGGNDINGDDTNARQMVLDAVTLVDSSINFANFDNDNDGYVDMVHIIYPGLGEHNGGGANAIWAHSWTFPSGTIFDNTGFYKYSCSSEKQNSTTMDGIGVLCHEMAHVLGLPDFYDTDYSGSGGQSYHLGTWDLMASGGYNNNSKTPPYLSGLERKKLGWTNYSYLTNTSSCTLASIGDSAKVYRINISSNEYYLLENRKKTKWDKYVPNNGLLIFHADSAKIAAKYGINANPSDRGFFIETPSADSSKSHTSLATFPNVNNTMDFTSITLPAFQKLKNWNKVYGKSITNITLLADSTITFEFQSSQPSVQTLPINTSLISNNSATIQGLIVHRGTSSITQKGFYWSTNPNNVNSTNGTTVISTSNDTLISTNLTGLPSFTNIYYSAFATNSLGTQIGKVEFFIISNGTITNLPWIDGFENNLGSWTQTIDSGTVSWVNATTLTGASVTSPHSGTKYAKFYLNSYNSSVAKLISPIIDFTNVQSPYLSFWYVNPSWNSDQNILKIYYRASAQSAWTLIKTYNTNITNWTFDSIQLPNQSSYYQIAFEGVNRYGRQIGIDDIKIGGKIQLTPPIVITNPATQIYHNSAILNSNITVGTEPVLSKGFFWRLTPASSWVTLPINTNDSSALLTSLSANTQYEYKAFAITSTDTIYGSTLNFTTQPTPVVLGEVETLLVTSVTYTSAHIKGKIISVGNALDSIEIGFVYTYNSNNPNYEDTSSTIKTVTYNPDSIFFESDINIQAGKTYSLKAYIKNSAGIAYGDTIHFLIPTLVVLGEVSTLGTTNVDTTSATLNGNLVNEGGATSGIEVGFVYSTITNPVIDGANVIKVPVSYTTGMTTYSSNITGLMLLTPYYVKAYITNEAGTAYGQEITFTPSSGLNDIEVNTMSVSLYPNPARNNTNLRVEGIDLDSKIIISDVQGRIIQTINAKPINKIIEIKLNLEALTKGIYNIKIQNPKAVKTQKLIIR
ncbi:MAG: peptidase [Bacteroidetes bacterium]|nr:peptidase [Bacteroidota bacterium]